MSRTPMNPKMGEEVGADFESGELAGLPLGLVLPLLLMKPVSSALMVELRRSTSLQNLF